MPKMTTDSFEPMADELVARNAAYASAAFDPAVAGAPTRNLAVVACMDSRLDVLRLLGLENGDAHVIRNAGGVLSDDVIRSLCLSQRALGTREIVLVHHTKCGVRGIDEDAFRSELSSDVGEAPAWPLHSFDDPHDDVRASIARLKGSPFVPYTDHVTGFVYNVDSGLLEGVDPE